MADPMTLSEARERHAEVVKQISEATGWGAYLSVLHEERIDLELAYPELAGVERSNVGERET